MISITPIKHHVVRAATPACPLVGSAANAGTSTRTIRGCASSLILLLLAAWMPGRAAEPGPVWLDDLAPTRAQQGWGELGESGSVGGGSLAIAGRSFSRGLGTHAASELIYELDGDYTNFSAWVGVDDFLKNHPESPKASVVFQVYVDGTPRFDSGVMRIGDAAQRVNVAVADSQELRLVVTDAGDGISCDHADWAEALLGGRKTEDRGRTALYRVEAPGLTLQFDGQGRIAETSTMDLTGQTRIGGCRVTGEISVAKVGGGYAFTRTVADAQGRRAAVTDRFTPDGDAIRWQVEITSPDDFWTAPIVTRLGIAKPEEKLIWTAWGSPDFSGTQLSPELTALVQAGKASVGGSWSDPLLPVGFLSRRWHYGNVAQACPVGSDYLALPLCSVLAPGTDTGLSLVLAPDDVLLDLDLAVSAGGQVQFTRTKHRLGGGRRVSFTMHLVPHEASWRGGLRFLTARHPAFFEAPNPRAHRIAGCGAYSICEAPIEVEKFKRMAFGFNWKLSDDFPYMGMFLPPITHAEEQWQRSGAEPCPPGKGPKTSARQMNDYARYMKTNGFSVLSYFNVTEYGKHVNPRLADLPPAKDDDPELWKDSSAYMKAKLPQAWLRIAAGDATQWGATSLPDGRKGLMSNCYGAAIVDPGEPDYLAHLLEQAARHITWLPDTDGICIDRLDWLRFYNITADDGVSWNDGQPARSLYRSFADLMAKMGPLLHQADKVIFANLMTMRLELGRELDGIYTEFGDNGNALNASALLGTRKPVVAWTYNGTLRSPNPDAFMQRHLHLGCFPTAPYPYNNHCITPEPAADQLYTDYGPLLNALRGKKWVLAPHAVACPTAKVNLFETPAGYALPVTFGGTTGTADVVVRNVPGLAALHAVALHPGQPEPVAVDMTAAADRLTLRVPLARGCAMIIFKK